MDDKRQLEKKKMAVSFNPGRHGQSVQPRALPLAVFLVLAMPIGLWFTGAIPTILLGRKIGLSRA